MVPIGAPGEVLTVHKDAIVVQPSGPTVFVVEDGKVNPRRVVTGDAVGNRLQIIDGLQIGELVVTRGNERLQPGQAVRVIDGPEQEGSAATKSGDSAG